MNRERKIPIRTCVACRESSDKKTLMRIVRGSDGDVRIDLTGKLPGRGAYLCDSKECIKLAIKANKLGRALRCELPGHIKEELEKLLVKHDA